MIHDTSDYEDPNGKHRRPRHSPPPPSKHPVATTVKNGYVNLRNEHYTKVMGQLDKANAELTAEINDSLKSDYQKLEDLANQSIQLHGPLSDEDAEYSAKGADGRYRTISIPIKDAVASFEGKLESTATSLEELWAS
ncbi:hypothetical protein SLS62_003284 [Diatrype stigma]|uniref:Uncharacterized protein n=1 Tax=Diatrype stigma TaxID=117547 RepID=A0AAN9UWE1_9PEZI